MPDRKGLALIAVIIIIVVAAIIVFGISGFISSGLALNVAKASREGALFAAQAGVLAGINDYLASPAQPYWVKANNVNIIGNSYYSVGKDANFLLIDADNPQTVNSSGGTNNQLQRVPLANINQTQTITVNRMKLEWYNFGGNLNRIVLGNTTRWSGTASSGTQITLASPFTLAQQQSFAAATDNTWRFSTTIPKNAVIIATFYFTDGSSIRAILMNNGRSGNKEFSITATGTVRGTTDWKRTIEATYDMGVNRIISWQETESHL